MRSCIFLISSVFLFISCKPTRIIPYIEKKGDNYCVYRITKVNNTGTSQSLQAGDFICFYCDQNYKCALYGSRWVHVYLSATGNSQGGNEILSLTNMHISYYIEPDNVAETCASCPGENKFQMLK
jgi:hypothetical protein